MTAPLDNGRGRIHHATATSRGRRTHATTVTLKGCSVDVSYEIRGNYLPATDIDAAEKPTIEVVAIDAGGVDIYALLSDEVVNEIQERLERELVP